MFNDAHSLAELVPRRHRPVALVHSEAGQSVLDKINLTGASIIPMITNIMIPLFRMPMNMSEIPLSWKLDFRHV